MIALQAIRVLILSGLAFLMALALAPLLIKILIKYQAGKQIRKDAPIFTNLHQHKEGTPTMGGIVIWGTTLVLAFIFFILNVFFDGFWNYLDFTNRSQTYLPLAAIFFAALIGLADDILGVLKIGVKGGGLKVRHKLIIFTLIALVGAWWFYFKLDWTTLFIPFIGNIEIGWWYFPFFMFVIIATAFSANETDGLDGLLGGVSLFAFGALGVVAFTLGRYDLAAFSGVIIGSLLAFLWHNIYPAKFFMGDTGSMALGITLGVIAMLTNTAFFLPFFAVILIIESLSVIIQLISKKIFGRKIFLSAPIHHHFEAIGWPESQITMRFWIISAVFAGLGIVLFFLSKFL
ncbi:MAG: Phospho-N-acetylmuramoyl-pentapeptide-transferase [Candidatus Wolfebacteria bacterium GW2011_GWA1_44_24]|uniref:Phospho-N-acetylmuramoyl-pentapeptide-transferase n=2 Tax=Candidatus Wolfeibacteriota TaxID=1752735 RepID=A0A0G0WWS8_9BACT|nr:MAG: Phospho-N-acetylmuramoyl-pentapeptide-transferase [Candidatus Wolfebacteria bacterium GW2011_GWB1_41_12]KKT56449.1 MAG: Phospho-N-acetylmuramoyl-pentapeptide-transferase [Candidatus Wolfebacteria bacterium GW2011_GWA1_44_24]